MLKLVRRYAGIMTLLLFTMTVPSGQTRTTKRPAAKPGGTAVASIEAGIVYNVGGPQPVARATFRLLNADLAEILRDAGWKGDTLNTYGFVLLNGGGKDEEWRRAIMSIETHTVASAMSDFRGRCRFKPVPAGTYYVTAFTETRGGFVLWNMKVMIHAGANRLMLDQSNAALAF